MSSSVLELYFISRKDVCKFGLCPRNLCEQGKQKTKLSPTSVLVCQMELMLVMLDLWRSGSSVCQAGINLKSGIYTAVYCSRPHYLQNHFFLHCVQRMLCTIKPEWVVQCWFWNSPGLHHRLCFRGRLPRHCVLVTQDKPKRDISLCGFCIKQKRWSVSVLEYVLLMKKYMCSAEETVFPKRWFVTSSAHGIM